MNATDESDHRTVHCEQDGGVGWLRLDNVTRHNAMSLGMFVALAEGARRLAEDPAIRAIIVAGAGGKAFCAGGDISAFDSGPSGGSMGADYMAAGKAALERLRGAGKPTIAMIEGYCLGGGVSIATACDLRIAADSARLGIPAAKRGVSYDFEGIRRVVQLIGPSRAQLMLYTGRQFGAGEAYAIGLVDEVAPAGEISAHTRALAQSIADNAPLSIAATRLIVAQVLADPDERDLAACEAAGAACLASDDHAEATRAFLEKRPPVFTGH